MRSVSILLLTALAACTGGSASDADAPPTAPAPAASDPPCDRCPTADQDSGATSAPTYLTLDDLPGCDAEQPDAACVHRLFYPLKGTAWPFDAARVAGAMGDHAFAVAPTWDVTAHHVLEADLEIGQYGCFFDAFEYASDLVPLHGPGCGEHLVAGGHPHAPECLAASTPMANCVDEVPFSESFDLVVVRAPKRAASIAIAKTPPAVGDEVFVVGNPGFFWLSDDERAALRPSYPFVSYGHVVRVEGRGIVADAAVYGGNSGGPMLNRRGEVVGVLSTKIGDERKRGTPIASGLEDRYAVAAAIDDETRAIVDAALSAGP